MWALVTELLFSFVLLAFLVISCQNVLHIASGSVRSVLTYVHNQLDRELGEGEGVADEEENVTTRVVRRRVILKVQGSQAGKRGGTKVRRGRFVGCVSECKHDSSGSEGFFKGTGGNIGRNSHDRSF